MTPKGIKSHRRKIHAILSSLERFEWDDVPLAVSQIHLSQARMWLGEALVELPGAQTPYPQSLNPDNETIEEEVDVSAPSAGEEFWPDDGSRIKYVKELRASIVDICEPLRQELITGSREKFYQMAITQALTNLVEARMWLGQTLQALSVSDGSFG